MRAGVRCRPIHPPRCVWAVGQLPFLGLSELPARLPASCRLELCAAQDDEAELQAIEAYMGRIVKIRNLQDANVLDDEEADEMVEEARREMEAVRHSLPSGETAGRGKQQDGGGASNEESSCTIEDGDAGGASAAHHRDAGGASAAPYRDAGGASAPSHRRPRADMKQVVLDLFGCDTLRGKSAGSTWLEKPDEKAVLPNLQCRGVGVPGEPERWQQQRHLEGFEEGSDALSVEGLVAEVLADSEPLSYRGVDSIAVGAVGVDGGECLLEGEHHAASRGRVAREEARSVVVIGVVDRDLQVLPVVVVMFGWCHREVG